MKATTIFLLLVLIWGLWFGGMCIGKEKEIDRTREKLNSCIHAPTPIEIGDSLYLIRVYPINSQ